MEKKFLAFTIPYYGRWPKWVKLFLDSCSKQKGIYFFLISDNPPEMELPKNVYFAKINKSELAKRIEEKVGIKFSYMHIHKICDYKPFYGKLFNDLLTNYEFWGYCDIDLVFGNITSLINQERFKEIDIYSPSNRITAGHCTILRNNDLINNLCFQIEGYHEKLLEPLTTHLDEISFNECVKVQKKIHNLKVVQALSLEEELKKDFAEVGITMVNSNNYLVDSKQIEYLSYKNGKTYIKKDKEVLYLHFMGLKRYPFWIFYNRKKTYNEFCFSPIGFLPYNPNNFTKKILIFAGKTIDICRKNLVKLKKKKALG